MSSPSKRKDMDVMKLMMSDYDVEPVNDSINEINVEFHGPAYVFLNDRVTRAIIIYWSMVFSNVLDFYLAFSNCFIFQNKHADYIKPKGELVLHSVYSGRPESDHDNFRDENACSSAAIEDSFPANLALTEGEAIYDYCWYPYMSSSDPVSCVFATTTRDHPIHLWDATTGQLRCTYRAYDAMDEVTAAFSIGSNPTGTKMT